MTSYANQKTKLTTFAGSAILVFSSTAFSAGRIEASLSPSVSISPHSSATVVLHVRNVGDEPVLIYRWNTPFIETGRLPGPVFDVSDESGRPVRYLGRRVHVGPARLAHYVSLAAGDSLEKEVDLGKEYEFDKAGWYTVNFSLYLNIEPDKISSPIEDLEGYVPNVQEIVATNPVTLLLRHPIDHTSMVGTEAQAITCDIDQSTDIESARIGAKADATRAERFLNTLLYVYEFTGSDFVLNFHPHPRYTRWFGPHDPQEAMPEEPGWGNGNNAQVKRTIEATALRLVNGVISPTCGCSAGYEDTLAWVEDHTPYSIHFCKKFFEMDDLGWDSKRSTVYHEMTHFYDSMLDGRADQPGVMGQESAKSLALTNRSKAVRSAANFEYFITDTGNERFKPVKEAVVSDE